MKRRNRSLAPIGMMVLGGLLVVGAFIVLFAKQSQYAPLPTALPTSPPEQGVDDGIPRVSVGDAKAAYDLKEAVFVDVRAAVFYEESHIAGALSIPLDQLETRLNELDPSAWIIAYCT